MSPMSMNTSRRSLYYPRQPIKRVLITSDDSSVACSNTYQTEADNDRQVLPNIRRYTCTPCIEQSKGRDEKSHRNEIGKNTMDLVAQKQSYVTNKVEELSIEDLLSDETWPLPDADADVLTRDKSLQQYTKGLEEDGTLFQILQSAIPKPPGKQKPQLSIKVPLDSVKTPTESVHEVQDVQRLSYSYGDPKLTRSYAEGVGEVPPSDPERPASCVTPERIGRPKRRRELRARSAQPVRKKSTVLKKPVHTPVVLPHVNHKYKPPDEKSLGRKYRQPWNEKAKLDKHDTEYLEIQYEPYLPKDSPGYQYRHLQFSVNHRHGTRYEYRIRTEPPKRAETVKKVERVWENEFKIFQLNKMLNAKLGTG